jgi:hypothetical protein
LKSDTSGTSASAGAQASEPLRPYRAVGPRIDGRLLIAFSLGLYYLVLVANIARWGWLRAWESLGVWPMKPMFGDLAVVLSGMECARLGYYVRFANPCDEWGRAMNYPLVWMLPADTGIGMEALAAGGLAIALLFLLALFLLFRDRPLSMGEGALISVLLVSPSIQFGVERGNNDLIVFFVVVLAVVAFGRSRTGVAALPLLLVAAAAVLKLFPIAALAIGTLRKESLRLAVLLGAAFVVYCLLHLDGLREIAAATPNPRRLGFGAGVFPAFLAARVPERIPALAPVVPAVVIGFRLLQVLVVVAAFHLAARRGTRVSLRPGMTSAAFLAGGAIFVLSFAHGHNWDYRLAFLLLVVPQALIWIRERDELAKAATLLLAFFLASAWLGRIGDSIFHLDELFIWGIYSILTFVGVAWVRQRFVPAGDRDPERTSAHPVALARLFRQTRREADPAPRTG